MLKQELQDRQEAEDGGLLLLNASYLLFFLLNNLGSFDGLLNIFEDVFRDNERSDVAVLGEEDYDFVAGHLSPDVAGHCVRDNNTNERSKHQVHIQCGHLGYESPYNCPQHA
jgi:hypothetical protein